jgi:O-antigen/teichoic acid export membrane protein
MVEPSRLCPHPVREGETRVSGTTVRGVSAPPIRAPAPAPAPAPAARTSVAGSALGIIGSTIVTLAIGYVASIVLARSLGPAGRGLVAVIQADVSLFVSLVGLGTPTAITFYASRRSRHQAALSGFALIYGCVLGGLALLAVLLAGGWLADHQGKGFDANVWWLGAALIPLMYIEYFVASLLNARRAYGQQNRLSVLGRVGTLVATLALVTGLGWGVAGGLVAAAMISIVRIAGCLPLLVRVGVRLPSRHLLKATLNYGWRVAVGQLFRYFSGRFDVLVLSLLASLATVGNYAIAQMVAELVLIIPQSFGYVVMPTVASGEDHRAGPALRLVGTLALLGVAAVAVAGPVMIVVGFGQAFRAALVPFFILLPGIWMLAYGNICGSVLSGKKRPGASSLLAGAAALLTVVLDLALIPPFGAVGAAVASTAAYSLFGVTSLLLVGGVLGTPARRLLFVTPSEARGYWKIAATRLAIARHE